jgi:hypothetical protein
MNYTTHGPRPPGRPTPILFSALLVLCLAALLCRLPAPCLASHDEPARGAPANGANAPDASAREGVGAQVARLGDAYGRLPLSFEINEGQTAPEVKFLSRGSGYTIFLTPSGAVLRLRTAESKADGGMGRRGDREKEAAPSNVTPSPRQPVTPSRPPSQKSALLRMSLVGADERAAVEGLDAQAGRSNYLIGKDPSKWRTNVSNYSRVRYAQVYPGVDLEYYGNQRQLEYDFRLAPGADAERVRLAFKGADKFRVEEATGDLLIETAGGELRQRRPFVYQETADGRREIEGRYRLLEEAGRSPLEETNPSRAARHAQAVAHHPSSAARRSSTAARPSSSAAHHSPPAALRSYVVGFELGAYDRSLPLVIDPVLSYSTFLGGAGADDGLAVAADSSGAAYVTGFTASANFPTTPGAADTTINAAEDCFVSKLNSTGTALVYSTFLGGNNNTHGNAVAVDPAGSAYVAGVTQATDFPVPNGLQTSPQGGADGFLTKLSPNGSALSYSTYLGGSADDSANGVALGPDGNAYVVGNTQSANFVNAIGSSVFFDDTLGGTQDAFVVRLDTIAPGSNSLIYGTLLGGSGVDGAQAVAVDIAGDAIVTGSTASADFPVFNAADNSLGGARDAFVTKLIAPGATLVYSTFLGGSGVEDGLSVAVDSAGDAYVATDSFSADFPTTPGVFQTTLKGTDDATVTKYNPSGGVVYSTFLGGSGHEGDERLAVDRHRRVLLAGSTDSNDFPVVGALQTKPAGGTDAFVARLDIAGAKLDYSTYVGGTGTDGLRGLALDPAGNAYIVGTSNAPTNYPTTPGAFQTTAPGGDDAFASKLSQLGSCNTPIFSASSGSPFSVGNAPTSVAVGDFNGDGKDDIITTNGADAKVSVLLGNGAGGFSQRIDRDVGASPSAVAVGDFNRDGLLDAVVVNQIAAGTGNVHVLLGDGTGNFPVVKSADAGDSPISVAVGDINHDGNLDVAVGNLNSTDVSIMQGDGAGNLAQPKNYFVGGAPRGVALADVNGDGELDLVYISDTAAADQVAYRTSVGDGAFTDFSTSFNVGTDPSSLAVGDFDRDGHVDLVVSNKTSSNLSVLINADGMGNFTVKNFSVTATPAAVAVGDFNGDGRLDIVTANFNPGAILLLLGDGAGGFSQPTNVSPALAGSDLEALAVGDFDGDTRSDLAAVNFNQASVNLLVNTCGLPNSNTLVVTNTNDTGAGSLRQAILDSNASAGTKETIVFHIAGAGVHTIAPASPLPVITDPVSIDGTTQPGFNGSPLIELDGTNAGATSAGLVFNAGNSTARALVVNRFGSGGGIQLNGGGSVVAGCLIGTTSDGASAAANNGDGVLVTSGNNRVGGTAAGDANVIAFNAQDGVGVTGGAGNSILSNSVHDNGSTAQDLGIDLGGDGVTPDDAGDADAGPNNSQNFPVLSSAVSSGGQVHVVGALNSTANTTFRVEFFDNAACDPSGNGEGARFLGSANVSTDGAGNAPIDVVLPAAAAAGHSVTATATSAATNDTSEFSPCVAALATTNWTGSVSTDWHTAGNWDTNSVPNASSIVTIPPAGVTNEPTISAADATAASVTVQTGRTLTMQSGRTLAAGAVTLDAGGTLRVAAGQAATVNADMNVNGAVTGGDAASVFNFVGSNFANAGSVSVATLRFGGTTQSVGGAGLVTSANTVILSGSTLTMKTSHEFGALTVNNSATLDQSANSTLTVGNLTLNSGGLLKNLGDGDLILKGDVSNAGTIQLNGAGAACGDADTILIRSSVAGTQRAWSGAGTFQLTDVDVKDQAGTSAITVLSGTNSGGVGANWTFAACNGAPLTFSISGRVADSGNQPLLGVSVHLSGSASADTTTDAAGNYTFAGLTQNGSFNVTPSETNYRFTPPSRAVNNLQSDQTGLDFTGALVNHTISGMILDARGQPLPGVSVTLAGAQSAVTRTNQQGGYAFASAPDGGSFTVTPDLEGFTFAPPHAQINSISADTRFDSTGTPQASPTPTPDPSDDFSGGPGPDPNKWAIGILTNPPPDFDPLVKVFLAGGLLHIQPRDEANGPNFSGLVSVRPLDLNSTPIVSVEVVQAAQGDGAQTIFGLGTDSDNWFRFLVQQATPAPTPSSVTTNATNAPQSSKSPSSKSASASTSPNDPAMLTSRNKSANDTTGQTLLFQLSLGGQKFSTGIAYNPSLQRFWRFRYDAPAHLIIFETSPDAATWTEQFRAALPAGQTALIAELSAGTTKATASPTEALFDNFLLSPSPRVQFSATAFTALESDGAAHVQIVRTGSDESPASVDFATSDGTARAGSDYTPVSGTVLFGVGERLKTVDIPLVNDNVIEDDETVNLDLRNPVGGRLGSITHAALTILDDDQRTNPIDRTDFFVRQHYLDFLGREPDAAGLQFWTNNIESCGTNAQCREVKRIDTSAAFFLSIEFQETGYVVHRFYKASFGRAPKFSEYLPDLTTVREGVVVGQPGAEDRLALNKQLFAEQFVARAQFKQAFGGLNEMQYVDALLSNAGLTLAEEQRTALIVGLLTNRETRASVLLKVVENADFKSREFNPAFIEMEYFGYLRRDPDSSGFQFWLAKLNSFGGDFRRAEMVKAFLSSTEYRQRFGQP